ncbi:choice-of-anchor R domain-containing protein [Candidatus Poriferisodalis sp.]|uniref:choice-of-anchor R domain-containing protein n=1 Tax=Candidatus Poriferisodalis sp. TaxID=3101277 RepID=UPI003AF9F5B8
MTVARRRTPRRLLLVGLGAATLASTLWLADGPNPAHAQVANNAATGRPVVLVSAEDPGVFAVDVSAIADADGIPNVGSEAATGVQHDFSYRWIRVDGSTETAVGLDSPDPASTHYRQFHGQLVLTGETEGATPADIVIESGRYRRVEDDIGKLLKVEVSFTDSLGNSETVTSLPFGPVPAPAPRLTSTLVANTGQASSTTATITGEYQMGFELGTHGQGYEISSVSIDLAAAPSSLTVSLWMARPPGVGHTSAETKLFDFENPPSFKAGLNKFTAPPGAFAYQGKNVRYLIVLSDFGASLSIKRTDSDDEDAGGEARATLDNSVSGATNVLRLAIMGSQRNSGILVSTYAQIPNPDPDLTVDPPESMDDTIQEIVSQGDEGKFEITVGAADRYLIRGLTFAADNTARGGIFTNPWQLRDESTSLFSLVNTRQISGINEWTAPQGATVSGSDVYNFYWDLMSVTRAGGITVGRIHGTQSAMRDEPKAEGVTIDTANANTIDIKVDAPYMAVFGEALDAMVQNLGQSNNSYASADSANPVLSQGFTTGSDGLGYRLQGIGVEIEGSNSEFPDSPRSVAVSVHADVGGRPGEKLFDLLSPSEFAAGHSFFEAPPGMHLAPGTDYVMVWRHVSGTAHRLERTTSSSEDAGVATDAAIADVLYRGTGLSSLDANSGGNSLSLAVYTEVNEDAPFVPDGVRVPLSWRHIPAGVGVGGQFRLVFVSHNATDAVSDDIGVYNELVRREAAGTHVRGEEVDVPYTDAVIRRVSERFAAVVCTASVDATANTDMDGIGVPVHWLDGGWDDEHPTLIADSYSGFYSDTWENTEYGAYVTGNSALFEKHAMVWTGCDSAGSANPMFTMGNSNSMKQVAAGSPRGYELVRDPSDVHAPDPEYTRKEKNNFAPVGAVLVDDSLTDNIGEFRPIYGISPVFTVVR